jgi:hypothetical protein
MCAASAAAPIPLYNEGKQYWRDLTAECRRYVDCVNATLVRNGIQPDGLLECMAADEDLQIIRAAYPSIKVNLTLNLFSWGPVISSKICGQQKDGTNRLPREFELPIATDVDSQTVAIYDEGRSFSPHEVASYLTQFFHPCYPDISFPC